MKKFTLNSHFKSRAQVTLNCMNDHKSFLEGDYGNIGEGYFEILDMDDEYFYGRYAPLVSPVGGDNLPSCHIKIAVVLFTLDLRKANKLQKAEKSYPTKTIPMSTFLAHMLMKNGAMVVEGEHDELYVTKKEYTQLSGIERVENIVFELLPENKKGRTFYSFVTDSKGKTKSVHGVRNTNCWTVKW